MSYSPSQRAMFPPPIILNRSPGWHGYAQAMSGSIQIGVTNDARLSPIYLPYGVLVTKLVWCQTGQGTGNIDIGIYDETFNRVVSLGSTATPAAGVIESDIADTYLSPGLYWTAFAVSVGNSSSQMGWTAIDSNQTRGMSVLQVSSAFPLPTSLTPSTYSTTSHMLIGLKTF